MLVLHFILITISFWSVLILFLHVKKPAHLFKLNACVAVFLACIDVYRLSTIDYFSFSIIYIFMPAFFILITTFILLRTVKILWSCMNILIFISLVNSLMSGFALTVLRMDFDVANDGIFYHLYILILGTISVVGLCLISKKFNISLSLNTFKTKRVGILVFFILFSYGFYLELFLSMGNSLLETTGGQLINLIAMTSGLISILLMLGYMVKNNQINILKAEKKLKEELNVLNDVHFETILQNNIKTQKYRHDKLGHLISIQALATKNENHALKQYVTELITEINDMEKLDGVITGFILFDAQLNFLKNKYSEMEIDVNVTGVIPQNFSMGKTDFTALFSNVLNNAFEGVLQVRKKKCITIVIQELDHYMYFWVQNNFNNEQVKDINRLETSKKDKENHGFGVAKIKEIVVKYEGSVEFYIEDDTFNVEIMIPRVKI